MDAIMDWDDIAGNWTRSLHGLRTRFPKIDRGTLDTPPASKEMLVRLLAKAQGVTPFEAEQELEDWIFMESLARQEDHDLHAS